MTEYATPVTAAEFETLIDGIDWTVNCNLQGGKIQDILARLDAIQRGWDAAQAQILQVNRVDLPSFSDWAARWVARDAPLPIDDDVFGLWYRLKGAPADFGGQHIFLFEDMQRLEHRTWKGKSEYFEMPASVISGQGGTGSTFGSVGNFTITLKAPAWVIWYLTVFVSNNTASPTFTRWNYTTTGGNDYTETTLGTVFLPGNFASEIVKIIIPHKALLAAGTHTFTLRVNRPNGDSITWRDENTGVLFPKNDTTSRIEAIYL